MFVFVNVTKEGGEEKKIETLLKGDLHNYPYPQCNERFFIFKSLAYVMGGPVGVDVNCCVCAKWQKVKFRINIV